MKMHQYNLKGYLALIKGVDRQGQPLIDWYLKLLCTLISYLSLILWIMIVKKIKSSFHHLIIMIQLQAEAFLLIAGEESKISLLPNPNQPLISRFMCLNLLNQSLNQPITKKKINQKKNTLTMALIHNNQLRLKISPRSKRNKRKILKYCSKIFTITPTTKMMNTLLILLREPLNLSVLMSY